MPSFIAELKSHLPEADWPVVVAALRNEAQTWAELQDAAPFGSLRASFGAQALQAAGAERARWSPGFLGLLRLSQAQYFEALRAAPMQPVSEKLRYQAAAAYEQLAAEDPGAARTNPDLAQATLLALALRERRRLLNGWDQLANDVSVASPDYWRLPIACLLGLIPKQHELLQHLLAPGQPEELHQLAIHALVSNPLTLDVQSSHLLEIIQTYELPQLMSLLRGLAQVHAPLAQQAALQALEDLQEKQSGPQDGLSAIQGLLLQAEIYQLGDQPDGAAPLLHSAWEAAQVLQADLAARVAETNGDEAETLASLQASADLADPKLTKPPKDKKRPAALISAARVALKAEDEKEATQMALAALKAATQGGEQGREKAKLLCELSGLLSRLALPQEAEAAAKAAMDAQTNNPEAATLLSQVLQANGRAEEALHYAHLAAALAPERTDLRRNLARSLQDNQQLPEAFTEWKAVLGLEEQPTVSDWLSLAKAALSSGHADETIRACQHTLDLQPANGAAHALMGKAVASQGDASSAIGYLLRATELAPGQLEAWLTLADLLRGQGRAAEAEDSLRTAQAHTAPSAHLQALLAEVINGQGRSDEALAAFQLAAQLAAEQAAGEVAQRVALHLSALQWAAGQQDAARQTLQLAQKSFPGNPDLARQFGSLLLEMAEPRRALASFKVALQAAPEDVALLMDVARAQLAVGEQAAEAEQTLRAVLAHKGAPAEARALLAKAFAAQGNHTEAVKQYEVALKSDLAGDVIWRKRLSLGKALSQGAGGKPLAAINTLEAFDKEQAGDLDILRALCAAYKQAGRAEEAAQLAQQVYSGAAESEETLLWYAELMQTLGKSAEACKALRGSSQHTQLSPRAALSLGMLQWDGESQQAALKTFATLLAANDAASLEDAAGFLLKNGSPDSIVYYQRALDLTGPSVLLLDGLAHAYIKNDQLKNALETVDLGIKLAPHKPQGLELKADILQRLGKPKAALQALNSALGMLPRDPALLGRKAGLLRAGQDWGAALNTAAQAFELDPGHMDYLQCASELAVLCLQPNRARGFFSASKHAGLPSPDLACLQAELALEAGEEIAAAKLVAAIPEPQTAQPRLLALQAQLAACRGDRGQAAELLQQGLAAMSKQSDADLFAPLGLARAAERLNDWETAIQTYGAAAMAFPGLLAAQFGLGHALTLHAEWQYLCEASQAIQGIPGAGALSKQARAAARQAFEAAVGANTDPAIQAMLAGWQQRAELRFGAALDLEALPRSYPANAGEAAALIFAAQHSENSKAAEARIKSYINTPEVMLERPLPENQPDLVERLSQAAKQLPQSAPAQALAAYAAYKAGQDQQALPFIQRALALWPSQPSWQALAGRLQQEQGRFAEASQHFRLAAELQPEEASHYFALGKAQAAAKLIPATVDSLQKAVDLQPKQAEYLLALARAHRQAGDDQQAKSFAQQAHKAAPESPAALLLQAELALSDKDAVRAKDLVEQALRQAPKDSAALQLFGETLYALGQAEDAVAVLDRAAKAAADEVPILIRRAEFLPEGRGLDALVKLSQKYPQRAEVFFALSQMLALTGNLTEAVQAAQHAVKTAGILPAELAASIHLHLGLLLKHSGNLDQSLHHLDEAIRLRPQALEAYLERGRVFLSRRQHAQAIAAFQQAAAAAPLSSIPHFEAGMALKDAKDFTAAESALRKAANLAPKDRNIQRQLAAIIALNLVHHPHEVGVQA